MYNYQKTLASFAGFIKNRPISLKNITSSLIGSYEKYLERRGLLRNSISFYMRVLRAVYNRAVKERLVKQTFPFEKVYTGVATTKKRAVGSDLIERLNELTLRPFSSLEVTRDIFVFSLCARGMAFIDLAYLKKSNIKQGNIIEYTRSKTGSRLFIKIEPYMQRIIEKYARKNSVYLFPFITSRGAYGSYAEYRTALTLYNRNLKTLASVSGSEIPLSSYTARHTWASLAHRASIPISVISAAMGHTSEHTTQIYLKELDNSIIDEANSSLLASLKIL